jgi:hypothetical protein
LIIGLKIAFLDGDGNAMATDEGSRPGVSRSRSNTDFSNHTWVPVPDNGLNYPISADRTVKFFDETEDISRIMSAPNIPTSSVANNHSDSQVDAMDYEQMFSSFNSGLPSPFGNPTRSPFHNTQTSPFHQQTSPTGSSNLGLERLVLSESPNATFKVASSQGTGSPPYGHDFDTALANFNTGIPIESMLDLNSMEEPTFFTSSNVVTEQTARLMRHYIDNLASWMDLSDSRTHFSTVVPKRALTSVPLPPYH